MNKIFTFFGILLLSVFNLEARTPGNFAPSLVADFIADATVICAGDSVHFTDLTTENPDGWTWTFDGGDTVTSIQQNPTVVYNTPGVYRVHLKANNEEEGDEEIKEEYIKVLVTPSSTFTTSSSSQCIAGNSFSFTNTGSTGTHFWGFAGASPINSTAVNPTGIVFSGVGIHSVSHKVTDDGCSSTTIMDVILLSSPTALAVTTTASNCAGANGTLTIGATTGGTAPFTYSVNGSNFSPQTFYAGRPPISHTITVKDANGCTFTRTATVGSSGGPTAVATQITSSTCGNANGIIVIGTVTGGVAPYVFAIDNGALSTTTTYSTIAAGNHVVKVRDANGCQFSKQVIVSNTVPSAVVITKTPTACVGSTGTITLGAVTGGRSPYTFSVDGSSFTTATNYTGLAAGTHTITVKDVTGCTFTTTTTITTTPGPTAFGSSTTPSACSSPTGSISANTPLDGTPPYLFSFNGGTFSSTQSFTGLAVGTYTITVKDANGCTSSQVVGVSNTGEPTAIGISIGSSACTASTGTITLGGVTGGSAPYTYSIDGSAFTTAATYTGLSVGSHTIVVKDVNGCTFSTSATITNTQPTAVNITTTPTSCFYSTGTINIGSVTGGVSPFVYSVNGSAFTSTTTYTGKSAGTYTVSVKDFNGCVFTQTAVITSSEPTGLAVTASSIACGASNGTVTIGAVTGGVSPFTYSFNGSAFTTTTNYTGLVAGAYTVIVKDANACTFSTSAIVASNSGPTAFVVTNTGATCTGNNGTITAGAVTGGTAPFTYSLDNGTFTGTTTYIGVSPGTHSVRVKDAGGCIFTTVTTITNTPGPTNVVLTITHANCSNNGAIDIGAVTGGTLPYTYSLDGGAFTSATNYSGLAPGLHQVMVKDANNCTLFNSRTINGTSGPTAINFTFRHTGCSGPTINNGFITISGITGGTAPYTYSLNGSAFTSTTTYSQLGAGTYTITVKDVNGCTFSTNHTMITVPQGPQNFTASEVDPTCGLSDGSVTITNVTGGTPPLQYKLGVGSSFVTSNTFTGLVAGAYPLNILDANGCETGFAAHPVLSTPGGPSAVTTSTTNSTCNQANGSITATSVTGGVAPYQYSFNGSAFQSSATFSGVFSGANLPLVVRDANGCTFTQHRGINNTGQGVSTPFVSQSGFLLTSNHPTGNQWFFNGVAIAGSTAQTHFAQFNGSYTVVASQGNCSSAPSTPVVITNQSARYGAPVDTSQIITEASEVRNNDSGETPLVIAENTGTSVLIAYPNPNDGVFTISFNASEKTTYTVEVFNVFGQVVFTDQVSDFTGMYTKQLQLEEFGAGVYTVVLTSPDEKTVQKVVTY